LSGPIVAASPARVVVLPGIPPTAVIRRPHGE
jgi:hypothetical protein